MQSRTWVLLRGLVREQRHWEQFPGLLAAALPAGSRVVCIDLPGNGEHWQQTSPVSIAGMVEAARGDLSARGVEGPVCLLALSLGAMTAFEWMGSYPEEIEAAVLLNTSLRSLSPFWHRLRPRNYLRILRDVLLRRAPEHRERMVLEASTNLLSDREFYVRRWTGYAMQRPVSIGNSLRQLLAAARYRAPANPPRCPVLLLNGAGDRLVDPRCSDAIAHAMQLPLRRHPAAGHDLALDAPGWVVDQVTGFIAGDTGPRH